MAGNYTTGGALFHNDRKKNEKEPDLRGFIEVDRAIVDDLIAQLQSNPSAKIDLAGWRRQPRSGGADFFGMSPSIPYNKDGQGGGGQQRRNDLPPPPSDDLDDEIPF